ncbi:hypothetical protein V2J09_013509 [Rumex salicifolius]
MAKLANDIHGKSGLSLPAVGGGYGGVELGGAGDGATMDEMLNGDLDFLQISDATVEVQETNEETKSKKLISPEKGKTGKLLTSKPAKSTGIKSGKGLKVASNGTQADNVRPKQPNLKSSKSFSHSNKVAPKIAASSANNTKLSAKYQSTPSTHNDGQSDAIDKTEMKPVRKEAQNKIKGDDDEKPTKSPTSEDAKSCRAGKLPAYNFSFRCNERAEKRREFYSKLEEKIHAKEAEKINQEAKSKESHEAEIRKLRKSLNFKAIPMPSFYKEPPPPKTQLKKQPTTRPKSPKLGRRKSSSPADTGSSVSYHNPPKARLSLGGKFSHDRQSKTSSPVHTQKPQRKSLPKLPSQKTVLAKTTQKASQSIRDLNNNNAVPLPSTQLEQESGEVENGHFQLVIEVENGQEMIATP